MPMFREMKEEGDSTRVISSTGIEGIEMGVVSLACRRRHNCPFRRAIIRSLVETK